MRCFLYIKCPLFFDICSCNYLLLDPLVKKSWMEFWDRKQVLQSYLATHHSYILIETCSCTHVGCCCYMSCFIYIMCSLVVVSC